MEIDYNKKDDLFNKAMNSNAVCKNQQRDTNYDKLT